MDRGGALNQIGPVKAIYEAGSTIEVEIYITAHHMGVFDFDLCLDASDISEECFNEHRLLIDGCTCGCPDGSNNCPACQSCREWWKAYTSTETGNWLSHDYESLGLPLLPGDHLVRGKYTVFLKLPEGVKSSSAVLRWHYLSTNSCSYAGANTEEFWNCADIQISMDGDVGPPLYSDLATVNAELVTRNVPPEDLLPKITNQILTGLVSECPMLHGTNPWDSKPQAHGQASDYHCGTKCSGGLSTGYAYCYTACATKPECCDNSCNGDFQPACSNDGGTPEPPTLPPTPEPTQPPPPTTTQQGQTASETTTTEAPIPTNEPTQAPGCTPGVLCWRNCAEWYFLCTDNQDTEFQYTQVGVLCKDNQLVAATECFDEGLPTPDCQVACFNAKDGVSQDDLCSTDFCKGCNFCASGATTSTAATPESGTCVAIPNNGKGCTDAYCAQCADGYPWWPCKENCCECNSVKPVMSVRTFADYTLGGAGQAEGSCGKCDGCLSTQGNCELQSTKEACWSAPGQIWCPGITGAEHPLKKETRYLPKYDKSGVPTVAEQEDGTWIVVEQTPVLYFYSAPDLGSIVPATFFEIATVGQILEAKDLGNGWIQTSIMSTSGFAGESYPPGKDDKLKKCLAYLDLSAEKKKDQAQLYTKCVAFQLKYADDPDAPPFQPDGRTSSIALVAGFGAVVVGLAMAVTAFRRTRRPRSNLLEDTVDIE